jgi:cell wall-associated NlpC family hydrolase
LRPQHGLPHCPVGQGQQRGQNSTLNDDRKTEQNRSSTLPNKYRKTTEVKTAAEKERRGRHHHTERATAVQKTNTAVLLHPKGHRAACRNTESEATLACAGTTNPPHSTPHSLVRGDRTNPPHGSTLQTRRKDCRRSSTKRCPALKTKSSCRSPQRLESSRCFPLARAAAIEPEVQRSRLRRHPTLYRTGEIQPC